MRIQSICVGQEPGIVELSISRRIHKAREHRKPVVKKDHPSSSYAKAVQRFVTKQLGSSS
ncbi:hypothetical protein M413DRAFT_447158, partial [Hebeloma cylindrosporum]